MTAAKAKEPLQLKTKQHQQQRNAHDVKRAEEQANKLLAAIAALGVQIPINALDVSTLRLHARVQGLCRLLVAKGVVTEAEVQYEEMVALCQSLGAVLQQVETARLSQPASQSSSQGPKVEAVRTPKLLVARH